MVSPEEPESSRYGPDADSGRVPPSWNRAVLQDVVHESSATDGGAVSVRPQREGWDFVQFELHVVPLVEGLIVVEIEGDIDVHTAPQLLDELENLESAARVLVDLKRVGYCDSFGLGTFVKCLKLLRQRGGNLGLVDCHWRVQRMLSLTGVEELFEIFPDRPTALQAWCS